MQGPSKKLKKKEKKERQNIQYTIFGGDEPHLKSSGEVLIVVDGPDGALGVLDALETLVKA